MPIVLDCAPGGAIIGGHFYSFVPEGAVESGAWRVVIPQAIYARAAHFVGSPAPMPPPLPVEREVQMGGMAPAVPMRAVPERDVLPSQREEEPVAFGAGQENPPVAQPPSPSGKRPASPSLPTAPSQAKKPRSDAPSLIARLPIGVDIHETTGVASVANTSDPHANALPRASQISHIGIILPTRRAILLRHDNPYVCNLCGEGFPHPADVRAHFSGHTDIPGRGCWMKNGSKAGVTWDEHESCKVREAELNFVRCKEGWVIVDQESWDMISRATEAGKRFLEGKDKDQGDVREEAAVEEAPTAATEEVSVAEERQQPKTKVAGAGDETEADTGAPTGKGKKAGAKKAASKKKAQKTVDQTDTSQSSPAVQGADFAQHDTRQASMPDAAAAHTANKTDGKADAPVTMDQSSLQSTSQPKANAGLAANRTETEATDAAAIATKPKAPPKRKVVRAGDETETDVSASRKR